MLWYPCNTVVISGVFHQKKLDIFKMTQIMGRKPQAASRKPQAASRKPQAASRKPRALSACCLSDGLIASARPTSDFPEYLLVHEHGSCARLNPRFLAFPPSSCTLCPARAEWLFLSETLRAGNEYLSRWSFSGNSLQKKRSCLLEYLIKKQASRDAEEKLSMLLTFKFLETAHWQQPCFLIPSLPCHPVPTPRPSPRPHLYRLSRPSCNRRSASRRRNHSWATLSKSPSTNMSALSELFALEKAGRYEEALERIGPHRRGDPGFSFISPCNLDFLEKRLRARLYGLSKEGNGAGSQGSLSELFALEKAGRHEEALERIDRHRRGDPGFSPISPFNLDLLEERLRARLSGFSKSPESSER
jgi:hypothetical protein